MMSDMLPFVSVEGSGRRGVQRLANPGLSLFSTTGVAGYKHSIAGSETEPPRSLTAAIRNNSVETVQATLGSFESPCSLCCQRQ